MFTTIKVVLIIISLSTTAISFIATIIYNKLFNLLINLFNILLVKVKLLYKEIVFSKGNLIINYFNY